MKKFGTQLKKIAGMLGIVLLIVSSIGAGLYGAFLNTSPSFLTPIGVVTMAGLGVGIGTGLIEFSIILLITGEKGRRALEKDEIPEHSGANYIRKFLVVMSRSKERLMAMLIIGVLPWAYWVARPLYVLRPFQAHVPEYVNLVMGTSPGNEIVLDDDDPEEPGPDATPRDRYGNPLDADKEDAPAQSGPETPPRDTNGLPSRADANEAPRESLRNSAPADARPKRPSNLPVKGKIMAIDVGRGAIDPVFFDLSDNVRPQRPDDVGAIAALFWSEARVGRYGSHGGKALTWHCNVQVFDKLTKSLLAERSFVGGEPPWLSTHGTDQSGTRPYPQIRDFLNSLPHQ